MPDATRLAITGAVQAPRGFAFEELAALPEQVPDIGALVPKRRGQAVRLAALLERCEPEPAARFVTLLSSDGGFSACVPLEAVREGLVTYALDDAPLPAEQGGPIRFFIPEAAACEAGDIDHCANVKFLAEVILSAEPREDGRPHDAASHAALHERERRSAGEHP